MKPLRESLRNEFYEWEKLGRGELVWDVPVEPEPYFVPFFGHGSFVQSGGPPVDDGKRERIWKTVFRPRSGPPPLPEDPGIFQLLSPLRAGVAPHYTKDKRQDIKEARWNLPASIPWQPSSFESVIYSLGAAEHPVCFEILATDGEIELQWVVSEEDRPLLVDALSQASFPPALEWRENRLQTVLLTKELPIVWDRELALEREFVFPIQTDFSNDPLTDALAFLNHLDSESMVVIQVNFQACLNRWAESLWRLVTWEDGKPFFSSGGDFLQATKIKCRKPLFAATVRLTVFGSDDEQVDSVARRLARSFACFEGQNGFVLADPFERGFEERILDLIARRSRRSGMILNGDELLRLVHPPASGVGAPGLVRLRRKSWPAPRTAAEACDFSLGINEYGSERVVCGLETKERLRHMHVLGASGTGKSTFLLQSILQDLEDGHGLALLDPHGDLVDAVLNRLPAHRVEDIVLFDPSDTEWPVGFNILQAHSEIERNLLASDFVAIFERLSSSWGDQMTAVLGNAAMAFLESDRGGTLLDLKRFLIEESFRKRFLPSVKDPEVRYFWEKEFKLLRGNTQASLVTRLNGFLRHRLIRNMVAQRGERFNVGRMMDEGKVVLAPLSQGLIGQESSWLLGSLLVSQFYQAALARQSMDEFKRRPFFLYLDEAHNFVTPSIASILSGARKYGLGLILSHQEIEQFPSRESGILGSILTNCHSRVYFRLGDRDATRLESGFDHFDNEDFRRLRVGEAICRIGGSDRDFNLSTLPPPESEVEGPSRRKKAIDLSRASYASTRESIERSNSSLDSPTQIPPTFPTPLPFKPPSIPKTGADVQEDPPQAGSVEPQLSDQIEAPEPSTRSTSGLDPIVETSTIGPPPLPPKEERRTPGRGGARHKLIQRIIKQHANGLGLRASVEADLAGPGSVDVLLEGGDLRIAFEVALKSPIDQEVRNIAKAIEVGISEVVVVSDDRDHLIAIKEAALRQIDEPNTAGIEFVTTNELGEVFAKIGGRLASKEVTSRGYKVKVNFSPPVEDVRASHEKDIHRAVADRRKKAEEGSDE